MNDLFITATGTDVGKTHLSLLILRWLQSEHCSPIYYKPLATGCRLEQTKLFVPDLDAIASCIDIPTHTSFVYEPPQAPYAVPKHLSNKQGPETILQAYQKLQAKDQTVIVEGIGGVAVPLWFQYRVSDLMVDLNLPVLLVADANLGTINHTLLSLEHLQSKQIKVLGFILNHPEDTKDSSSASNVKVISDFTDIPYLFTVEYGQDRFTEDQINVLKGVLG